MRFHLHAGIVLFVLATFGSSPISNAAPQVLRGHVPAATSALRPVGRLSETNLLSLRIGLPLRDKEGLTNLLRELSDPASPNYRQYLTPEQFTERFGPTVKDYNAIVSYARANGLTVNRTHPNRLLVNVTGAVKDIERTFNVAMQVYQHPQEARSFYAPDSDPSLDLSVPIVQIGGLNDYSRPLPRLQVKQLTNAANAQPNLGSGPAGSYMGKDFRAAYVPDTSLTGSGQTVGLVQFDGYNASDITYYETMAGLPNVPLENVLLDGFNGFPSGYGGEVEVCLDIQMVISMAPGISKVIVYMAGPYGDWHDMLNRIATDNKAKQVSCSWYTPYGKADPVADQIFQEMAAQGQSFFNASGDYDAFTGLVDFPGDTPYITQVGGTTLSTSGAGGAWSSETVWNEGNGIGSGGGISTQYTIPSWQTNISMTACQGSTTKRNIPDVAMTADNIYVRANGRNYNVGGTSCAAPLWAAFAALVNQQAAASGKPPIGFANPTINAIATGTKYASCFHDTTTGNNTSSSSPNRFYAVPGYDLCTGWGTPAGQSLINALATPESLGIQPGTGFVAIGGTGGPFTISTQSFVLTNFGTTPLNWSIINTSLWLNVNSLNGTLSVSSPATEVTVSLSPTAYNLPIGTYNSSLVFSNITSGTTQNRNFTLQIVPSRPPGILAQPANQTAFEGGNASFSVIMSGTPPMSYQWTFNGAKITGATNPTLSLANVLSNNAGYYAVTVTNTLSSITSSNALLTVLEPPPTAFTPPDLVSWWPAEANANDLAGLNNGFLVNGPSYISGHVGQAFKLNGTNQYISIIDSPSLRPSSLTVEGWFNFRSTDQTLTLIAKAYGNGSLNSYALWYSEGELYAAISSVSGTAPWLAWSWTPSPNTWHHIAYTYDVNAAFQVLYVDGVAVVADWADGPIDYDTHPLLIGADIDNGSPTSLFNGSIDEVSFYNRALEAEEIASVYRASGSGKRGLPPILLTQPKSQSVALGSNLVLEVQAAGSLPLAYQWSFNGTNIINATNSTHTLTGVTFSDAGHYAVTVSNPLNAVLSQTATLTVMVPVALTSHPQSQRVAQGTNISFSVTATGATPISYQWYFNGAPLADATGSTLSFTNVQSTNAGSYSVLVSNAVSFAMSSNALLAIDLLPVIIVQPISQTVMTGTKVTFTAGVDVSFPAVSSGALRLWLKADDGPITNAAGFVAQWQDKSGNGNHAFQSNQSLQPLLVNPPTIGGRPAVRFDGIQVASQGDCLHGNGNVGLSNALTSFLVYFTRDASAYEMVPAYIGAPPAAGYCRGYYIPNGKMSFSTWGYDYTTSFVIPTNTFRIWTHRVDTNKTKIDFFDTAAQNSNTFTIAASHPMYVPSPGYFVGGLDPAFYTGSGRNFAGDVAEVIFYQGSLSEADRLSVEQYLKQKYFQATPVSACSYQWQFNGIDIAGATNATLTLPNVQMSDTGFYQLIASNSAGSVCSSNALLTVINAAAITEQPQNQRVAIGTNVSFNVTAAGTSTLSYQWYFNGVPLAQATNSSLTLTNVQSASAGNYSVLVSDKVSSVMSSNAVLTVDLFPDIAFQPQSQTVIPGTNVVLTVKPEVSFPTASSGNLRLWLKANAGVITNKDGFVSQWQDQSGNGNHAFQSNTNLQPLLVHPAAIAGQSALRFDGIQEASKGDCLHGNGDVGLSNALTTFLVYFLRDASAYEIVPAYVGAPPAAGYCRGYYIPNRKMAFSTWYYDYTTSFVIPTNTYRIWTDRVNANKTKIDLFDTTATSKTNFTFTASYSMYAPAAGYFVGGLDPAFYDGPGRNLAGDVAEIIFYQGSLSEADRLAVEEYLKQKYFQAGTSTYTYQWQFNGTNIAGATNASLTLTNVQAADDGNYRVIVNNGAASIASSNAVLTVLTAPNITEEPQGKTLPKGSTATFSVAANGAKPLSYMWFFNSTNFMGTNASLSLTNVQITNAGYYTVIVSNSLGSDTSSQARLIVGMVTASNFTMGTLQNQSLTLPIGKILTNASDSLEYPLTVSGLSTASTNGGKVVLGDGIMTYTPLANFTGADLFTYTVSTDYGASATANLRVHVFANGQPCGSFQPLGFLENGKLQVNFTGIPGVTYSLQRANSVYGPWSTMTTVTVDPLGNATVVDPNPPAETTFYRMIFP